MEKIPLSIIVILFSKLSAISIVSLLPKEKNINYNSKL